MDPYLTLEQIQAVMKVIGDVPFDDRSADLHAATVKLSIWAEVKAKARAASVANLAEQLKPYNQPPSPRDPGNVRLD